MHANPAAPSEGSDRPGGVDRRPAHELPSQATLVALMRILRLVKRVQTGPGPVEPALVWVLHVVDAIQPTRLSDLATHMHLDLSTASRHVRSLEMSGHLVRAADPADRRAALISLTDEGRDVLRKAFADRCRQLDVVLKDWREDDRQEFRRLLTRLADDLENQSIEKQSKEYNA